MKSALPETASIALNAAGLIPYRTGLYTIDMLGLNDHHIARQPPRMQSEGFNYPGHFKHDGQYVLEKAPDLVITGAASLLEGTSSSEALMTSVSTRLSSDVELMKVPGFESYYQAGAQEVLPGKYAVAYLRRAKPVSVQLSPPESEDPEEWFQYGRELKLRGKLPLAAEAFKRTLQLCPDSWTALTELAYCYHDMLYPDMAVPYFEKALALNPDHYNALFGLALAYQSSGQAEKSIHHWIRYLEEAPDSVWKDVARDHLAKARAE